MNFNDAGRFVPRSNLFPSLGAVGGGQGLGQSDPRSALIQQASNYGVSQAQGQPMQRGMQDYQIRQAPPMQDDLQMLHGLPQPMPETHPQQPAVGDALQQSALLQHIRQLLGQSQEGNQHGLNMGMGQINKIHQVEAIRRLSAMLAQQYHGTRRQFAGPSGGRAHEFQGTRTLYPNQDVGGGRLVQ